MTENASMESSEVIRDEENTSKNSSWENTMENVAADGASGVEHAHSDGSQRDHLPVPDGINRMMNNGVRFSTIKNSWNSDYESVSLKSPILYISRLKSRVPTSILLMPLTRLEFLAMRFFLSNNVWHPINGSFRFVRPKPKSKLRVPGIWKSLVSKFLL